MTTIHRTIEIDAPPGKVMNVLTDPERLPEYAAGVTSVDEINSTEDITGSTFRVTYSAVGFPLNLRFRVTDYEPGTRIRTTLEGGLTGSFLWELLPVDDRTQVNLTIDYQVPGGPLGQMANRVMVERINDTNAQRMLESVKKLSEGDPTPQPT